MSNDSIKQVIVMRTRYPDGKGGFFKPRTGKLIAQGAHASMAVLLRPQWSALGYVVEETSPVDALVRLGPAPDQEPEVYLVGTTPDMREWLQGSFTKVCVQVDSEEELRQIVAAAEAAKLPVALIEDLGRTEFHGVKTATCCAIGPAKAHDIDPITGHLRLL